MRTAAVFFFFLSISVTAKTLEQEAAFKGRADSSAMHGNTADDSSDALGGLSGDAIARQNAVNLLRILSRMDEGGFDGRKRRNWMNRESLRVWGKREGEVKPSFRGEGGAGSLGSSSVHRTGGDNTGVDLLMTLKERLADDRRRGNDVSTDEGKFRSAFPFDIPLGQNDEDDDDDDETRHPLEVGSGELDLTRMPSTLRGLDGKRKWERNALRIWGKRNSAAASEFSGDSKDHLTYPNVRRRKWENLPLRVWGK